jgi:hypothetical protein
MKDLIIGCASNYSWDHLKYWVNSIKKSGFSGDVVIVGTNMKADTISKLSQEGVLLSLYGTKNSNGDIEAPKNNAPHVERFFYIWNYLSNTKEKYQNVITTDTRDVIFQKNPSEWLEDNLISHFLVSSSEGIRFKNEPWNNQNLHDTFGPYFHNLHKENMIYNVGTIAGDFQYVKSLMFMIFQMSINRPIPIVDQAVYNVIVNTIPWSHDTLDTSNEDAWVAQLGATQFAVESGKGDLGMMYQNSIDTYKELYEDQQPVIENGIIKNSEGNIFTIVHQYDRVPSLKEQIEKIYGD